MGDVIDESVLGTFAVVAEPEMVADGIRTRFGDIFTRMHLYLKTPLPVEMDRSIVAELRS